MDAQLKEVFAHFPRIVLAVLFGSVALGRPREGGDLDIAVINALAELTGRCSVDLIDLSVVAEPLLGQVVRNGRRVLGSDDTLYGDLIRRHLFEQADFLPYRTRLLAERRVAWIGK